MYLHVRGELYENIVSILTYPNDENIKIEWKPGYISFASGTIELSFGCGTVDRKGDIWASDAYITPGSGDITIVSNLSIRQMTSAVNRSSEIRKDGTWYKFVLGPVHIKLVEVYNDKVGVGVHHNDDGTRTLVVDMAKRRISSSSLSDDIDDMV